jgi:hypothetical protein
MERVRLVIATVIHAEGWGSKPSVVLHAEELAVLENVILAEVPES